MPTALAPTRRRLPAARATTVSVVATVSADLRGRSRRAVGEPVASAAWAGVAVGCCPFCVEAAPAGPWWAEG